jgi:hypothetical protein
VFFGEGKLGLCRVMHCIQVGVEVGEKRRRGSDVNFSQREPVREIKIRGWVV